MTTIKDDAEESKPRLEVQNSQRLHSGFQQSEMLASRPRGVLVKPLFFLGAVDGPKGFGESLTQILYVAHNQGGGFGWIRKIKGDTNDAIFDEWKIHGTLFHSCYERGANAARVVCRKATFGPSSSPCRANVRCPIGAISAGTSVWRMLAALRLEILRQQFAQRPRAALPACWSFCAQPHPSGDRRHLIQGAP